MCLKSSILFLLTINSFYLSSQVLNIEKYRTDKDTSGVFLGNVGLGFTGKNQRTDVLTLNTKANLAYLSKQHSYLLINTLSIVKIENTEANNAGYAHLRFNFFRKKRLSIEQFNQIQFDVGRGLCLRELTGLSARYKIFSDETTFIAFNTGAMLEYEIWEETNRVYRTFIKSTSNITFKQALSNKISLFLISYYQARPNLFFKPRIISDAQLQFNITKNLSFSFQFESTYDANPVIDIQNHIYTIKNNLNFSF